MGFPVFCRGTCVRGTTKGVLGSVNLPILFGEVPVSPGDLVVGDDDGLVIIPQAQIETVLDSSRKRVEAEKKKAAALGGGVSSVEFNQLEPVFVSLGLIEE
jgi:4-hydroxy-4-methyl-2-oxoglutarate aldolase